MKLLQIFLILVLVVLGFTASDSALAGRGGVRFGVFVGPGFWYPPPYHYYPPYYYPPFYPPVVYPQVVYPPVVAAPQIYIEQNAAQPAPAPVPGFWYYCGESKAYYPYTKECPGGWQRVAPQPANQ